MPVYWTLHFDITDSRAFARCLELVPGVLAVMRRHGGRLVGHGVRVPALDGPSHSIDLLCHFEAGDGVEGFLADPDCAEAVALWRQSTTDVHSVIVPLAAEAANHTGELPCPRSDSSSRPR